MTTDDARILGEVIGRLDAVEKRLDRLETRVDRVIFGIIGVGGVLTTLLVINILLTQGI